MLSSLSSASKILNESQISSVAENLHSQHAKISSNQRDLGKKSQIKLEKIYFFILTEYLNIFLQDDSFASLLNPNCNNTFFTSLLKYIFLF